MHQEHRDEINTLIRSIRYNERGLDFVREYQEFDTPLEFDIEHDKRYDLYADSIDSFNLFMDTRWARNFCKETQTQLNYYYRKAGFKNRKITAYM